MTVKPNFLFIGPDKSGSSWLYEALSHAEDVFVAPAKDLYYFDRYYHLGEKWYVDQFRGWGGESAVGEICHDYLFSSMAASRIARDLPNIKLLVSLRDPVARTFSHYLYLRRSGLLKSSLLNALGDWPELVNNSLYGKHLCSYYEFFSKDQIHIGWFDELSGQPLAYLNRVHNFLRVPEVAEVPVGGVVRGASYARFPALAKAVKIGAGVARDIGLAQAVSSIKHSSLVTGVLYKEFEVESRPVISSEETMVLREIFYRDVERLEAMIGVDLRHWLE